MITQEQIEKISDDFQSTFMQSQTNPDVICNLMYEHEHPQVEEIVRRHVPDAGKIAFVKGQNVGNDGYAIWGVVIYPKEEGHHGSREAR